MEAILRTTERMVRCLKPASPERANSSRTREDQNLANPNMRYRSALRLRVRSSQNRKNSVSIEERSRAASAAGEPSRAQAAVDRRYTCRKRQVLEHTSCINKLDSKRSQLAHPLCLCARPALRPLGVLSARDGRLQHMQRG